MTCHFWAIVTVIGHGYDRVPSFGLLRQQLSKVLNRQVHVVPITNNRTRLV